VLKY